MTDQADPTIPQRATSMLPRALVVSIHDASPLTRERIEGCLRDLRDAGIERTSLLVIPFHHRKIALQEDAATCDWLKSAAGEGHEIVHHGWEHLREPKKGEGPVSRLTTSVYTAGEGEFYDLDYQEALEKLARGREVFERLELPSRGFVAPAWLLSAAAEQAVKESGYDYTTRVGNMKDLSSNQVLQSRAMVYSVRNGWRRQVSLLWNTFLYERLKQAPLVRLALHPVDYEHPQIWRQIIKFARAMARDRQVTTYDEWLELWRSERAGAAG